MGVLVEIEGCEFEATSTAQVVKLELILAKVRRNAARGHRVESPHGCFNVCSEEDRREAAAALKAAYRDGFKRGEVAIGEAVNMATKPGPWNPNASFPIVENTDPPDPLGIKL